MIRIDLIVLTIIQLLRYRRPPPASSSTPSNIAPSTLSQGGDFTTQAALSSPAARQSNNIVNTNTHYDIIFVTSTTAAIKEILVIFPAGTDVSVARLVEAEGIGKGTVGPGTISGQIVRYIVLNAEVTTIPAGTQIRLEFSNIVNPPDAGNGYRVNVQTRGTSNNIIDGPTQSFAYPIKQIGSSDIADGALLPQTIEQLGSQVQVTPQTINLGLAFCPPSHPTVTGGGFATQSESEPFMHASDSSQFGSGAWEVIMYNSHPTATFFFVASVSCMAPMP